MNEVRPAEAARVFRERKAAKIEQYFTLTESKAEEPFFSVIIPVYNKAPYLHECIASLEAQTFRHFETVFVNDGSLDDSLEVLKSLSAGKNNISILTQSNQGPSTARNAGIKEAKGRYLLFLDADDTFSAGALEHLHGRITASMPDVLLFDAKVIIDVDYTEGDEISKLADSFMKRYRREQAYEGNHTGIELFSLMRTNHDYLPNACFTALSRRYLQETDLKFEPGILHEDNLFTFTALIFARSAVHMHEEIYQRHIVENSIMTGRTTSGHVDGYFTTYIKMMEILDVLQREEQDAEHLDAVCREINSIKNNTRKSFVKLPEEEKLFYQGYDGSRRVIFEGVIADYCKKAGELKDARKELKKELSRKKEEKGNTSGKKSALKTVIKKLARGSEDRFLE